MPFLRFTETGRRTDLGDVARVERRPLRIFFGIIICVEAVEMIVPQPTPSLAVRFEDVCVGVSSNGESSSASSSCRRLLPAACRQAKEEEENGNKSLMMVSPPPLPLPCERRRITASTLQATEQKL
jgi:hypothetical protein